MACRVLPATSIDTRHKPSEDYRRKYIYSGIEIAVRSTCVPSITDDSELRVLLVLLMGGGRGIRIICEANS